jgi:Putative quorum-sensing-regulated virulence factor
MVGGGIEYLTVKMPFGKFKGLPVSELPDDYLDWLSEIELREPLRTAVEQEIEARRAIETLPAVEIRNVAVEIISAGLRSLSLKRHPDAGGSHEAMVRLNAAHHWLKERVAA